MMKLAPILLLLLPSLTLGFNTQVIIPPASRQRQRQQQQQQQQGFALCASNKQSSSSSSSSSGRFEIFQRSINNKNDDENDDNDSQAIMAEFFKKHDEWLPLFGSLAVDSSVPAMVHLFSDDDHANFDFESSASSSSSFPWKALAAIPESDEDKQIIGAFLDGTQAALMALPALQEEEDETDMAFLLEGRRMLAVSRFQVVRNGNQNDELFATCWNELTQLVRDDQSNTGSLILLPDTYTGDDGTSLSQFCDTRLQQPLEWLGMDGYFEIASINSQIPALRLLHKLDEDIPDLAARPDPSLE